MADYGRARLVQKIELTHGDLFANWYEGGDEPAGVTGERRSEVAKRAVEVIEKETENFSGTIVFVTHGGTVRSVLGSILKLPISQWGVIGGLSNACWSILGINTTSHWISLVFSRAQCLAHYLSLSLEMMRLIR